jgi:hypothetical protein
MTELSPRQSKLVARMLDVAQAAELDDAYQDFAFVCFCVLALAVSKLPEGPDRELFLSGVEGGALRIMASNYEDLAETRGKDNASRTIN